MRRLHVVLSDRAAEQLDELRQFWRDSIGETPSVDAVLQRALEDYHRSYMEPADESVQSLRKPAGKSPLAHSGERSGRSRAS